MKQLRTFAALILLTSLFAACEVVYVEDVSAGTTTHSQTGQILPQGGQGYGFAYYVSSNKRFLESNVEIPLYLDGNATHFFGYVDGRGGGHSRMQKIYDDLAKQLVSPFVIILRVNFVTGTPCTTRVPIDGGAGGYYSVPNPDGCTTVTTVLVADYYQY